jgi:cathepsin F
MKKHNKHYESSQEFQQRFENFRNTLRRVDARNAASTGAKFNITKFADMSVQEFRSYPCGVDNMSTLTAKRPEFQPKMGQLPEFAEVPAAWDWTTKGAVTGVKDQGQCGSCWAFSTVGNMEGVWFLSGKTLTGLSEEQIVDCSTTDYGCQGGWPYWALTDMDAAPYSGGIDSESSYPYTAGDGNSGSCQFSTDNVASTEASYNNYCNENTNTCTMNQLQQLLVKSGPLSACLDAEPMQDYSSGIDNPQDCDPTAIDHCITIVGYGTTAGTPFWKIKNSWGTDWGESGYYYLYRDDSNSGMGVCGINRVITIASIS